MADTTHNQPHQPVEEHPEHHEHSDIRVRPLVMFAVICIVAGVVIHVGLYLLFFAYDGAAKAAEEKLPRVSAEVRESQAQAPQPRVQSIPTFHEATPAQDMNRMRLESEARFGPAHARDLPKSGSAGYGPTDEPGYVRIPIVRAIEILGQRGIEPRGQSQENREQTGGGN